MSRLPQLPLRHSLAAPGLPVGFTSPAAVEVARQADQVLGLTANLAGVAIDAELARARADEQTDVFARGAASRRWRAHAPITIAQIEANEHAIPEDDAELEKLAAAIVDAQLDETLPSAFRDQYRADALPAVTSALILKRGDAREDRSKLLLQSARDAAAGERDPAALARITIETAKALKVDVEQVVRDVGVHSLAYAAAKGDQGAFDNAAELLGERARFEQEQARAELAGTLAGRRRDEAAYQEDTIHELALQGAPIDQVLATIEQRRTAGDISSEQALSLRSKFTHQAQQRRLAGLRTRMITGATTGEAVFEEVSRAVQLSPDDPGFIDPNVGMELIREAKVVEKVDREKVQVVGVLAGGPGNLTEGQHGTALAAIVGPDGAGMIDGSNRIAEPATLAAALLQARILPAQVRETILANLTSSDAADLAAAAQVIGAIGNASPRLYARLLDSAPDDLKPALDAAVDGWQRGRLQGQAPSPATVQAIRAAATADPEIPRPPAEVMADLRRDLPAGKDLPDRWEGIVAKARAQLPHTRNVNLIDLWGLTSPDPSLGTAGADVLRRVENWYTSRFAQLRTRLPRDAAIRKAEEYATAQLRNAVDFTRWEGVITPVLIDQGETLRLPEPLRWGEGFEDEARADLKAAGFNPDTVAAMRPYLDPPTPEGEDPEARMGWLFIDTDGDVIRDDQGAAIVFRPSDPLARRNAEFRALLDSKEAAFARPRVPLSLLPPRMPHESDVTYARRIGRKRPGEF